MTEEQRLDWIKNASLEALLEKWRFEPSGSPWFGGRVFEEFSKKFYEMKRADPAAFTRASKRVGWEKP